MLKSLAVLAVLTLAGCAPIHTEFTRIDPSVALPPVPVDSVRVFTSPDRVSASYTEIAIVNSRGTGWGVGDETAIIAAMRVKAAELGANGLILGTPPEHGPGGSALWQPTRGRGVAIRIKD